MALTFDGGNYLTKASALVTAAPLTLEAWVYLTSLAANATIMGIASGTSGHSSFFSMEYLTASGKMCCGIGNDAGSTTDFTAVASTVLSINTWYHVACVFTSATSRACYVNGGNSGSSTVSVTPGTPDSSYIGAIKYNNVVAAGIIGNVAFPGFYNVALAQADITGLSLGFSPRVIRTPALVGYPRLVGVSPEPDLMGGSWTLVSG